MGYESAHLAAKSINSMFEVFVKTWQGDDAILVTATMAADIEELRGNSGFVQWACEWQHRFCIITPAMNDGHCRSFTVDVGRQEPAKQRFNILRR
jgi:hypothetical protein